MNRHLLAISIGPVQDFIVAARRTRDLWFGSFVLSEVSKAAAAAVAQRVGVERLIFPAPDRGEQLMPAHTDQATSLNVANVILTEVPEGEAPYGLSEIAKQAARARWVKFADEARQKAGDCIREDIWNDQVDDVMEFYAAWKEWLEKVEYKAVRRRVMQLLSARKACRDFNSAKGRGGIPKSSLDGARESVLKSGVSSSSTFRLADGEQLDVVGLTKRLAVGHRSYPSVARIAADPWLRRLAKSAEHKAQFQELINECKRLAGIGVISRVSGAPFNVFPYDGTAVFASRHRSIAKEADPEGSELSQLMNIVKSLTRSPQNGGLGEPFPYLAILVADGDRMGACISGIDSAEQHRLFSRDLAGFATVAAKTIENYNGSCVYAGGDDVLAFAPLDRCLECARALHEEFGNAMKDWTTPDNQPLTLSVGLAIVHFMEPLEDLLSFGRGAERAAKETTPCFSEDDARHGERDGMAIHIFARGGEALEVRERWAQHESSMDQRLKQWTTLFAKRRLPGKLPYEIRQLADGYESWSAGMVKKAIECESRLVLKRKQTQLLPEDRTWVHTQFADINDAAAMRRLAAEILVAIWLNEGTKSEANESALPEVVQ